MNTHQGLGTLEDALRPASTAAATCPSGKKVYPTRKTAELVLEREKDRPWPASAPVRVYGCERCRGWHLTSMVKET